MVNYFHVRNEKTCSLQLSDLVPYGSGCSQNVCQIRAIGPVHSVNKAGHKDKWT